MKLESIQFYDKIESFTKMNSSRRVFITGGAQGIGKATVEAFVKNGDSVAFCDCNAEKGEELVKSLKRNVLFFQLDVINVEDLEKCMDKLFEKWGDIDIIVNNVGVANFKPIIEQTVKDFDRIYKINLRPAYVTSRKLAIHRSKQKTKNPYGRIVNISSSRFLQSEPGTESYSATKGGIYSLTHALSISLSEYNITVNSISPGWIQTNNYESLTKEDHLQHPSKRVGKSEDISRMILFLCQKENDFINGENVMIDGGMTKKMIYVE